MKLRFHIAITSILFCACANNSDNTRLAEANADAIEKTEVEPVEPAITDPADNILKKPIEEKVQDESVNQIQKEASNIDPSTSNNSKTRSTIAQQQEAARKIQEELSARSPKPNEDKNLENAVFEKVVSTKKPTAQQGKATTVSTKSKPKSKKKSVNKYPAIEFTEVKMVFDTINQGDIIDHKFTFTNTGSAPLEIKSASASCGCTQPSFPFIPIEPNEQGHISVRYNSVGKEGYQNPEITINTNINSKEIILYMEGFVEVKKEEEEGK